MATEILAQNPGPGYSSGSNVTRAVEPRGCRLGYLRAAILVAMTFAGWVATLAGWYVTEIGRQPWLVYGVLRTADAATAKAIPIGTSLTLYLLLYAFLIVAYISVVFYLARSAGAPHGDASAKVPNTAGGVSGA